MSGYRTVLVDLPVASLDPALLLNEVRGFIRRFCVFPDDHALNAVTLWVVHTHMIEKLHTTPRLALLSPEPQSGKTRVLEVINLLVRTPMSVVSASAATIYRTLVNEQVTLLFDEVDAIFTNKGKDNPNEDLRALLNAGYKRGAVVPRCVGNNHEVKKFPVFAAVALAGLGDLPDTLMSRSIIIRMRRRLLGEVAEDYRFRSIDPIGYELRDRISAWASEVVEQVGDAVPEMPEGIADRSQECWEPLLALADQAGGHWPETARAACVALCAVAQDRTVTLGIRLLSDLRLVFGVERQLSTAVALDRLRAGHGLDEDAPWNDLYGEGLNARKLAQMLKPYGVSSKKLKLTSSSTAQGYSREQLQDVWLRYLPLLTSGEPELTELAELEMETVPLVPEVPLARQGKGDQLCIGCRFFSGGADRHEVGWCNRHNVDTHPTVPSQCTGWEKRVAN
jgi:hypothetical protein